MGTVKRMETAGSVEGQEQQITDMKTFAESVKHLLEQAYPSAKVDILEVTKNNGVVRTGVSILEDGRNMVPAIYLEEIFERYQNGMSLPQVCQMLEEIHQGVGGDGHFDTKYIRDFSAIKGKICYKLVNAERNAARLQEIPHRLYQDLAVVYYILLSKGNFEFVSITVKNDMMDLWGVDEVTLYELARKNTPALLRSDVSTMTEVFLQILDSDVEEDSECLDTGDLQDMPQLYVATNEYRVDGAAAILYDDVLEGFAKEVGSDFYILPSSVHEMLFWPVSSTEEERVLEIVRGINAECVSPEEILSDNIYRYYAKDGCIKMIC